MKKHAIRFVLTAASALCPAQLLGQSADSCGGEVRAGIRPAAPHAVETGSPVDDMTVGVALAVGFGCPVSSRFRGGIDVEANTGPNLAVFHFLAIAERRVASASDGSWTISIRGGAGWAHTSTGLSDNILLAAAGGRAIQPGTSGPAIALGGRLHAPLSQRFRLLLDVGWRGSFIEETDFDMENAMRATVIHVFPFTVGLGFRP